jgi:hypothetical protein
VNKSTQACVVMVAASATIGPSYRYGKEILADHPCYTGRIGDIRPNNSAPLLASSQIGSSDLTRAFWLSRAARHRLTGPTSSRRSINSTLFRDVPEYDRYLGRPLPGLHPAE